MVFTTIQQTKIAKRQAEQERQAGWKIDFLKITTAITTLGTPTPTEGSIFATKTWMEALPTAIKEPKMQLYQSEGESTLELAAMIITWEEHLQWASK